ncbi:prepilin peptidase [Kerstersia similis]|uniref:prepilin peptidase n=1 Tax=Kerstersia similis TaxID=206505 RepID=UPI0039EE169A
MWETWNLPVWAAWLLPLVAGLAVTPLLVRLAAWLPWHMQHEWAWHAQDWLQAQQGQEPGVQDRFASPPLQPLARPARAVLLLVAVALAELCAWRFGLNWGGLCILVCLWTLLLLAMIDARDMLLPDTLTQPLLWAGLLFNLASGWVPLHHALLGAVAGYGCLWLLFHGFRLATGREGMGHGDFKLLAALGAWVGLAALPQLILIAAVSGLAYGLWLIATRRAGLRTAQPFGVHLAWAGAAVLLWMGAP